jgi:ribonuclease P protein component
MAINTIKKRADFVLATASTKRFSTGCIILQLVQRNSLHPAPAEARFGFTVTKRMGNAVIRNRIKRRLREAVCKVAMPHVRTGHDYVIVSRLKSLDCAFADLIRDMEFAFSRIHVMKDTQAKKSNPS